MKNHITFLIFLSALFLSACSGLDGPPKHAANSNGERDYSTEASAQRAQAAEAEDEARTSPFRNYRDQPAQVRIE